MKKIGLLVLVFVILLAWAPGPMSEAVHQVSSALHAGVCK